MKNDNIITTYAASTGDKVNKMEGSLLDTPFIIGCNAFLGQPPLPLAVMYTASSPFLVSQEGTQKPERDCSQSSSFAIQKQ